MDSKVSQSEAIIAVSSAPGRSPRGLIRISGPSLAELLVRLIGKSPTPRKLTPATFNLVGHDLPTLVGWFPGPRTFTGEDIIELQLPGNPALLERVIVASLVIAEQIAVEMRIAEAGEFSRRAFLAGRIDLTEAEGIAATISAVSDAQLRAAGMLRGGRLGRWAMQQVDRLGEALALVEAGIDFVDQEDVVAITPDDLYQRLNELRQTLTDIQSRTRSWAALEALPWVLLVGLPNVGKSTLFNALLGRDRAIASPIAGTTRDVLTEPLLLENKRGERCEVMLVDLAGLEKGEEGLTPTMQQAADEALSRAELILHLIDERGVGEVAERLPEAVPRLRIATRADEGELAVETDAQVSGLTGAGIEALREMIVAAVGDHAVSLAGEMLALQPRHARAIAEALAAITASIDLVESQRGSPSLDDAEMVAVEMRLALDELAGLGGEMTPDDVIGKVFATFCVGK